MAELSIKELKAKKSKLISKAFNTFPNSPKQLKIRKEIYDITEQMKKIALKELN